MPKLQVLCVCVLEGFNQDALFLLEMPHRLLQVGLINLVQIFEETKAICVVPY